LQCSTGTGGAKTSTPVNPSASASSSTSTGTSASPGASGSTNANGGTGAGTGTGGGTGTLAQGCSPDSGTCGTTTGQAAQTTAGFPTAAPPSLGDGSQVALMALAAALLVGLVVAPPLVAQASRRRRQRGGPGWPGNTGMPGSPGGYPGGYR